MNRLLLVDDNPISREAFQRVFSSMGFSVMTASVEEGLGACRAAPDFVLLRWTRDLEQYVDQYAEECKGAWIYTIDAAGDSNLCAKGAELLENGMFWHRRLLRAMNVSSRRRTVLAI